MGNSPAEARLLQQPYFPGSKNGIIPFRALCRHDCIYLFPESTLTSKFDEQSAELMDIIGLANMGIHPCR